MVEFANIANLGLNFGPALERAGTSFGARQEREAAAKAQRLQDIDIEDAFSAIQSPDQATRQQGLLTIGRIQGPKAVQAVTGILDRGTEQQVEASRVEAEKDLQRNVFLESAFKGKSLPERARILTDLAAQGDLNPEDVQDLMDLQNTATIEEQDTKILRNTTSLTPAVQLLKDRAAKQKFEREQAQKETFTTENRGGIPVQVGSVSGKEVTSPRVPAAGAKPTTISPKDLTPEGELIQRNADGTITKTQVLTPEQAKKLNESSDKIATGETQIMDNGTVVNANKDGTVDVIEPSGRKIPPGKERERVLKQALKEKGDLARIQSGQVQAGKDAVKLSTKSFEKVATIRQNLLNLDKAITAVDAGAKSGAIASKFPSIRTSSVQLDQVQRELGIDKIGAVTFGALSKGEMDLALKAAIPSDLNPKALREWLVNKKAAQQKLMDYIERSALFLGDPSEGHTIKDWVEKQKAEQKARDEDAKGPTTSRFTIRRK